ncbi:MAG: hypothetical protein ACO1NZ_07395 [Adhaeribacter sp.]
MKANLLGCTWIILLLAGLGLPAKPVAQPLAQTQSGTYAPKNIPVFYYPAATAPGSWRSWVHMNTPVRGGLFGLGIGGAGGVVLGLSGKEWVLANGKTVSRPVHAVVDALIVGIPTAIIGTVVGARRERTTLSPTNLHFAIGGGWSGVMAYQSIRNAYDVSGIPNHIPHWFGYLHYPNGENSSTPYTWNLTADYNLSRRHRLGIAFNNFVKQQVTGGADHHHPGKEYERAMGETYSLVNDYILNPIVPENKTRLVFSAGAGVSYHNLLVRGDLGGGIYEKRRRNVTPHYRGMIEYFSRRSLSLQLKGGYRPRQTVRVPEQSHGELTLLPHAVNFRSLDITIGIGYHLNID